MYGDGTSEEKHACFPGVSFTRALTLGQDLLSIQYIEHKVFAAGFQVFRKVLQSVATLFFLVLLNISEYELWFLEKPVADACHAPSPRTAKPLTSHTSLKNPRALKPYRALKNQDWAKWSFILSPRGREVPAAQQRGKVYGMRV